MRVHPAATFAVRQTHHGKMKLRGTAAHTRAALYAKWSRKIPEGSNSSKCSSAHSSPREKLRSQRERFSNMPTAVDREEPLRASRAR